MFYFTGDIHGNTYAFINRFRKINLTAEDVVVILGDAGLNYYADYRETIAKRDINRMCPATVFCIHGNHERRPETISSYETKTFCGGTVYYEKDLPNLLFSIDGERYQFGEYTALVLGGAYSVDKYYRLESGHYWFEDEQMPEEKRLEILDSIRANPTVDLILSHTCPLQWQPTDLFLSSIAQTMVDKTTEEFLSECEKLLDYKHWLFGHFHANRGIGDKAIMLFDGVLSFDDLEQ